jgi:hypothetical protein
MDGWMDGWMDGRAGGQADLSSHLLRGAASDIFKEVSPLELCMHFLPLIQANSKTI